ncbi:MAG: IS630 family transposase [Thermoplasmata archaeon]|nr:IS630 family transposase [Thermoplasmata archaeon]MCI4343649.1 IS630 family transposase [Thermoplasmata archaeon]
MVFADESGFSLIPYAAKTWAPLGQTPVLLHQGRWPKFSAISGVTPTGRLYFRVHEESIRGPQVVAFLRHLLRHTRRRPIMVFWDNGPHHRSNLVNEFLETHPRLEVHRFPGYSPELNPDEWVWSHLKNHELASYAPHDVRELRRGVRLGVMRMRDRPALIRSFVEATHLYDSPTESARRVRSARGSLGGH